MFTVIFSTLYEAVNNIYFMLGYVTNSNSFPQPLSAEEEADYLRKFKHEGSEEARNILIERNLRLVTHIVNKKYSLMRNDYEDLVSTGTIGLIKAISTFNTDKDTRLATYAAKCIDNEILMYLRKSSRIKNEISLHEPIDGDGEGNETTLMDILNNESQSIDEKVETNILKRWLYSKMKTVLKKNEKTILELRYGISNKVSKTQLEIANMLGISRSYVSRIETRAIKKLNKELKSEDCL